MSHTLRGATLGAVVAAALGLGMLQAPGQAEATTQQSGQQSDQQSDQPPYLDSGLPIPERVADLLSRMTLSEKIGQMTQAERADIDADPTLIKDYKLGS